MSDLLQHPCVVCGIHTFTASLYPDGWRCTRHRPPAPLSCSGCARPPQPCATCGGAAELHEHVYDEWYCRRCWAAFGDGPDSQDADCFRIEGVALDVIPLASGG